MKIGIVFEIDRKPEIHPISHLFNKEEGGESLSPESLVLGQSCYVLWSDGFRYRAIVTELGVEEERINEDLARAWRRIYDEVKKPEASKSTKTATAAGQPLPSQKGKAAAKKGAPSATDLLMAQEILQRSSLMSQGAVLIPNFDHQDSDDDNDLGHDLGSDHGFDHRRQSYSDSNSESLDSSPIRYSPYHPSISRRRSQSPSHPSPPSRHHPSPPPRQHPSTTPRHQPTSSPEAARLAQLEATLQSLLQRQQQQDQLQQSQAEGLTVLSPRFPCITVPTQALIDRASTGNLQSRIRAIYSLLVPKEQQGRYCARGRSKAGREQVPHDIFHAIADHFRPKYGNVETSISHVVNAKAAQARFQAAHPKPLSH